MAVSSSLPTFYPLLQAGRPRPAATGPLRFLFRPSRRFSSTTKITKIIPPKNSTTCAVTTTAGRFTAPLICPNDHWGTWTVLFATAAFGIWSEKTKIGSMTSGAVVSILAGLAASNVGIVAAEAPACRIVMEYLLPLAIPLLLFNADLRRVVKSTGTLLLAFLLGSVATIIGTVVAYLLVPMRALGQDSWKIAAALMSSYIGGDIQTQCCWDWGVWCASIRWRYGIDTRRIDTRIRTYVQQKSRTVDSFIRTVDRPELCTTDTRLGASARSTVSSKLSTGQ